VLSIWASRTLPVRATSGVPETPWNSLNFQHHWAHLADHYSIRCKQFLLENSTRLLSPALVSQTLSISTRTWRLKLRSHRTESLSLIDWLMSLTRSIQTVKSFQEVLLKRSLWMKSGRMRPSKVLRLTKLSPLRIISISEIPWSRKISTWMLGKKVFTIMTSLITLVKIFQRDPGASSKTPLVLLLSWDQSFGQDSTPITRQIAQYTAVSM